MHLRVFILCAVAGMLLSVTSLGCAQLAHVRFQDSRVAPTTNDRIRLDSEQVIIRLNPCSYTVDTVLEFCNVGHTATEWVGIQQVGQGQFWTDFAAYDFIRLNVRVDGRPVEFTDKHDADRSEVDKPDVLRTDFDQFKARWLVKQITFHGHAKTIVMVSYEVRYRLSGMSRVVNYGLWTSRYWKGKIGKAVFVVDSTAVGGADEMAPRFGGHPFNQRVIADHLVKYEVVDYEPNSHSGLWVSFDIRDPFRNCTPNVFYLRSMNRPRPLKQEGR